MALVVCKECGAKISDQAAACPHCGIPLRTSVSQAPLPLVASGRGTSAKEIIEGIGGLVTIGVLFMIFGGSYRDAVIEWFNSQRTATSAPVSIPLSFDNFATVAKTTGCESQYSDERKAEIFDANYRDHRMTVSGQVVTLENGRASLKVLPKSVLQDISITFADSHVGYTLQKGSWIAVSFRMRSAGGCFLPYTGDLGELIR